MIQSSTLSDHSLRFFMFFPGGRDLVLYDAHHHRAFARRVTQEQAQVLLHNRRHSSCPLCKQSLSESWAFVVEGYWETWPEILSRKTLLFVIQGGLASLLKFLFSAPKCHIKPFKTGMFNFNNHQSFWKAQETIRKVFAANAAGEEETAAIAQLHSIAAGLLNTGYYARFFKEEHKGGGWLLVVTQKLNNIQKTQNCANLETLLLLFASFYLFFSISIFFQTSLQQTTGAQVGFGLLWVGVFVHPHDGRDRAGRLRGEEAGAGRRRPTPAAGGPGSQGPGVAWRKIQGFQRGGGFKVWRWLKMFQMIQKKDKESTFLWSKEV